ncbi:MAG: hypothetical protein KIT84_03125 [Labilithrix sp.]|nr:hypothetical protein [Labilithrix sp.]MCW5809974.1 hypothetical protein [Labilithrix sp.]
MRGFARLLVLLGVLLVPLLAAGRASAQVHWDASLEAGATKRFLTRRPAGVKDTLLGPSAQLASHVALLPLVHVGAYLGGDVSPQAGARTRFFGDGGLHLKGIIPFFPRGTRGWIFTGFGYAGMGQGRRGGGFFEVPFGFGASYKLRKPWELFAELGGKVGFAHWGSAYAGGNTIDRLALGLSVGVMLDL